MQELPWLSLPSTDFNDRCSKLSFNSTLVDEIKSLTNAALTINQASRLYQALRKLDPGTIAAFKKEFLWIRIGIVSNATIDLIIPSLVTSALRFGIYLEVIKTDFGQIAQEAFDPDSTINQADLDVILLALDYRGYPFASNAVGIAASGLNAEDSLTYLKQILDAFNKHSGAICIAQTLVCPPFVLAGNLDSKMHGMLRREIYNFNVRLADDIAKGSDLLFDVATIANTVGVHNWFDERQWYLAKNPMATRFIPLYTEHLARLVSATKGKSKKCLVLDLDNTLWGGVVGDDGIDGITIGHGNPIGEAFLTLQHYVLELKKLGIILAICSKNDEQIALQAFNEHPDMVLKPNDFAVFIANWEDKATNVRLIAKLLNIGLDSLVFVDDNPAEREIVRKLVPEVAVPELPHDPSLIPRTLSAAGYFEMIAFTRDDAQRSTQYAQNAQREKIFKQSTGLDDYLQSLDMVMTVSPFNEVSRKRITQLINKTNQFNLTTRRYTEAEVLQFETSATGCALQARLVDHFGDNGMISVVICKTIDDCWEIDSWLMSCRVIKRRVEEAICDEIVRLAREKNIKRLRGNFVPTERNALVKDHYKNLGFKNIHTSPEEDIWELAIDEYTPKNPPIKILHG